MSLSFMILVMSLPSFCHSQCNSSFTNVVDLFKDSNLSFVSCIAFLFSLSLISDLVFIVYFLLLALGLAHSGFPTSYKCRVWLLIWLDVKFINFPCSSAFTASYKFWCVVFSFLGYLRYFSISLVIFYSSTDSLKVCCLISEYL